MPAIFYREAYEAAAGRAPDVASFETWEQLAKALDKLTPEQRCDAVYADWLLQLHSPAHQALLQIRNLLIGQGALAANYLAELAQNADDAADGKDAEVRIVLDDDWLFVANNGRKVTSMNLLGLSRFFVHAAEKEVRELNAETIGRFGIGFKSSYRIASEVIVQTRGADGSFAFRLPICHAEDAASQPAPDRLKRLLDRLVAVGVADVENTFRDAGSLGYCTPEFLSALPATLSERTAELRQTKPGTLFCFHIRPDRLEEVQRRISGQAHEVYELCPLFLPHLCLVRLGPNQLTMKVGDHNPANDLPSVVKAERVTLTTSASDQSQSRSRFWRLREPGENPIWQVALHADSQHRLRLDHEDDERGVTLKDGAAYAYFPLNAVSWPFRFHLHVRLPTNLARDNWNPADAPVVEKQLRRAIRGMADWLDSHFDSLAGNGWSFEKLVEQRPAPMRNEGDWPARWANVVFEELCSAAANKPLLRTFGGKRVQAVAARRVEVVERQAAAEAWSKLAATSDLGDAFPVFVSEAAGVFGVAAAIPDEVGDAFAGILANTQFSSELRQAAMLAYLSTTQHSGGSLERALKNAVVELADHSLVSVGELMAEPCGTELEPAWHECFKRLAGWAQDAEWQSNHVFGQRVDEQFRKLSQAVFNPPWSQLQVQLGTDGAWRKRGAEFWRGSRRPCPPASRASALACLRVPSGDGGWLPLSGLWLDDETPVDCFAGLLTAWPLRYSDTERKRITGLLTEWGLFEEWERTTKKELSEKLFGELTRRLAEQATGDAFAAVFNKAFEDARRPLDGGWAHIVNEAEKTAVSRFLHARANEENLSGKTVLSASIVAAVRAALCLDAEFVLAPPWLTEAAHQRICRLGLQEKLGFRFLSQQEFSQQCEKLARELLEQFHRWKDSAPTLAALAGLNEMAANVSRANRRNWPVGLSAQRKPLLKELIHAQSADTDANPAEQLNHLLLQKADWPNAESLPALLAQVPSVAEACVQPHKLQLEIPDVTMTPIERGQIPASALEVGAVCTLVEAGKHRFFTSTQALKLRWRQDGEIVATLPAADYVVDGDKLIFAHSLPPADEEQFREVLALYQRYDVTSAAYRRDKYSGLAAFSLYQNHRDQITKVLIEKEVRAVGYEEKHVLRELLQNAESAYASKANPPPEPWFRFIVERPEQGNVCKVSVSHLGRAFNEPDKDGKKREDVDRIVKVNAPNQNTEDEVGRFNKGFKCVFSVARDQRVRIHSGGFDFEVQDLLLRVPANPERNPNDQNPETQFMFDADYKDVLAMLGFKEMPKSNSLLPVLNASSFVFLRHLCRVMVKFEGREWTWTITRQREANHWERVTVETDTGRAAEVFLVCHGRLDGTPGRCHAVAVRLGKDGLPSKLDADWRSLRLTFETDEKLNLDVLVNGQFDAEQGRRKLVNVAGSGLVDAAFKAAVARCEVELKHENSKVRWLAWARVLNLSDGLKGLKDRTSSFESLSKRVEQFFTTRIPHDGATKSVEQLVFPTGLMRELLKANYASRWGIPFADWIDAEVEKELPHAERTKFSLPKWLGRQAPLAPKLFEIQRDLGTSQFRRLTERFTQPQKEEFSEAQRILTEKLRPSAPVIGSQSPMVAEPWTAARLWSWWQKEKAPAELYTLVGEGNWPLLFPDDDTLIERRAKRLHECLAQPSSDDGEGLRVWYRLLSLACLLSSRGRTETLRKFWLEKLEAGGFWKATGLKCDFAGVTRELFGNLVLQRHNDGAATGEWADYWRRVFYDVRKVHELVWHHNFAETIVQLALDSRRAGDLTMFLRGGQLAGQRAWAGVLGQSSGAPLFFVARELCRLSLANSPDLKRLAFFPCTPVRRAALSIGWLQPSLAYATDFNSLARVSEQLHQRVMGHPELAKLFDIPLLHMGLTSDQLPPAHADD